MTYPVRQVAQVIALGQVVGMAASLVGGSLSDRWGHKRVLVLGVGATATSSLLYLFNVPWIIVLLWAIGSAGLGFATLGGQGYLTMAAGAGILGLSSALYNWGYTIGGAIGTPLAAAILGDDNFRGLGLALVGLGLTTTLVATFLPSLRPSPGSERRCVCTRRLLGVAASQTDRLIGVAALPAHLLLRRDDVAAAC